MSHILIIEPIDWLAQELQFALTHEQHTVDTECSGRSAFRKLLTTNYDAVVWDVSMWRNDTKHCIRKYRGKGGVSGLLAIGNPSSIEEIEQILDAGADDFLETPFRLRDFVARVKVVSRQWNSSPVRQIVRIADLEVDTATAMVSKHGKPIHLFPMEYTLLTFLMHHPNQAFSTDALAQRVWTQKTSVSAETIRTHIKTLRRKIDSPGTPSIILTEPRHGYKLVS